MDTKKHTFLTSANAGAINLFLVIVLGGGGPTRRLRRRALNQVEHVPARFADGGHFGDDGQVVDDKGDLVLLLRCQVVGVAQQTEACHVGSCVCLELVHKASR